MHEVTPADFERWYEKASDVERVSFERSLMDHNLPRYIPPGTPRPWWFELDDELWDHYSDRFRKTYELRLLLIFRWVARMLDEDLDEMGPDEMRVLIKSANVIVPALKRQYETPYRFTDSSSETFIERTDVSQGRRGRRGVAVSLSTQVEVTFLLARKFEAGEPRSLSRSELMALAESSGHNVDTLSIRTSIFPLKMLCYII